MIEKIKVTLRAKQSLTQRFDRPNVSVYAPAWVEQALQELAPYFVGKTVDIYEQGEFVESLFIEELTLHTLELLARNEYNNVTGKIDFASYPGIDKSVILSLKDLVRHLTIIGKTHALAYGGYRSPIEEQEKDVYLCDLIGIQFQQPENTGRLVLISEKDQEKGLLDNLIFEKTVGEQKASFEEAANDKSGRYINIAKEGEAPLFFDTYAHQRFIAQDFLLTCMSLDKKAKENKDKVTFKFVKYGAGFFARPTFKEGTEASHALLRAMLKGVQQALAIMVLEGDGLSSIQGIELPHYSSSDPETTRLLDEIKAFCAKNALEFDASREDAFKSTTKHILATTNGADPHATTGNEMNYGSVDAAFAENIASKANEFSPVLNKVMKQEFISVPHLRSDRPFVAEPIAKVEKEIKAEKPKHEKGKKRAIIKATFTSFFGRKKAPEKKEVIEKEFATSHTAHDKQLSIFSVSAYVATAIYNLENKDLKEMPADKQVHLALSPEGTLKVNYQNNDQPFYLLSGLGDASIEAAMLRKNDPALEVKGRTFTHSIELDNEKVIPCLQKVIKLSNVNIIDFFRVNNNAVLLQQFLSDRYYLASLFCTVENKEIVLFLDSHHGLVDKIKEKVTEKNLDPILRHCTFNQGKNEIRVKEGLCLETLLQEVEMMLEATPTKSL